MFLHSPTFPPPGRPPAPNPPETPMKKLSLNVEALEITSFETGAASVGGTVHAHSENDDKTITCSQNFLCLSPLESWVRNCQ